MPELLAHLCGDYVLQNHWMAQNKVRAWLPAIVHASLYVLPFTLLTDSRPALQVMWLTHLLIDRFRLARWWVEFWGVGCNGWIVSNWQAMRAVAANPDVEFASSVEAWQASDRAPAWLGVWLLIIVDNTIHLAINHAVLTLL